MASKDSYNVMEDSFSIFAEMLISKIFDYYLKEKIFPKRDTDTKLDSCNEDEKFDDYIKAIENDPQFESSTIRLLIDILKVSLGGEINVNYECTKHQVFLIARREDNTTYIKVDDRANIDVGIFFKTDKNKILIPFEVKTGKKSFFKKSIKEPKGHNLPNNEGTFPKMKGPVPGILAHNKEIIIKIVGGKPDNTNYSLFGLKEKPEGIQLNNFEDKKDHIVNSLKEHQYLINRNSNSIGFICRDSETLAKYKSKTLAQEKFQIISLEKLFSEFAEQYFKDRFDKEEKIFANTLKHLSGNIEFHFKRFIEFCSVRIKFNKNNKKLMYNYQDYISKFFTFKRKISDHYIEFLKLKDIENLKARSSEDGLIKAQNEWVIIIDIQKVFNGVFDLRKKRIEAEFNNYVHHFLNTIDTDFYNEWVQK